MRFLFCRICAIYRLDVYFPKLFSISYTVYDGDNGNDFHDESFVVEDTEASVSAYCKRLNVAADYVTGQDAPFDFEYTELSPSSRDAGDEPILVAVVTDGCKYPRIELSWARYEYGHKSECVGHEPRTSLKADVGPLYARFVIKPKDGGEPKEALRKRAQTIGEEMIAKYKEAHGE